MKTKKYLNILSHYESCLEKYGDTHLGVDWPKEKDVDTRYQVMLESIREINKLNKITLLDFGCGTANFYNFLIKNNIKNIEYSGLDLSDKFTNLCRKKYPHLIFYCCDILSKEIKIPNFDYIIMNGVFTEKIDLTFGEMFSYFKDLVQKIFLYVNKGLAFNVM